ncbi:nucleoside triphosphate pyrophosphohydrolase family protein [Crenobacter caeni]|uniref:Nucleoside triphosphate pyrophosphohydrolase family protein n=1 Tax=Crenobacter caeni TaxID=2705474 RepID=A0A6B2KPV4_9NEIS|nr:nucleoside triphosphate pyrophosphohydrolase family protein [Crenobacter caeni]NDV12180.1 nucleoside triphosphate pyrophosphohydrolase family protein [Crenobacter caeni]
MSDFFGKRRALMREAGDPIPAHPLHDPAALAQWEAMLAEELGEFSRALAAYRGVDTRDADALLQAQAGLCAEGVDVLNVVSGLLIAQGLPLEAMFDAIHAANLAKCAAGRNAQGKLVKPAHWQEADKAGVIRASLAKS